MTAGRGSMWIGNRYRLTKPLGRGGMGVVWAAMDELLGREVAIKEVIPPPGLTTEQAELTRTRSLREARAAARITSRSAVNVYDVVEEDGRPWIVMELLHARPLSEIIRTEGTLPPARVAEIATQLLDALTAAHASGVLHRDVKPSNVMIEAGGRVVLTDFGIAALDGDPALTTTGILIGSPAYIAPERVQGSPGSAASDLWSLGCTMFAALEGRPPFDGGNSIATLAAVVGAQPQPAPSAGPLAPIIEGLLVKDPRQRLTAEDTGRLLQSVMTAPTAVVRQQTRHIGPSMRGETAAVLPVLTAAAPDVAGAAAPVRPPPKPSPRRPRRLLLAALVVTAVAMLALVVAGVLLRAGDGGVGDQAAGPRAGTSSPGDADPAGTDDSAGSEPATESTTATTTEPTEDPEGALPDGFTLYTDETGFALAVPDGWEVTKEGPRTDFTEPGTGRFLRVDQTQDPQPDPVADWENQEGPVSDRLSGYERIRIEPVEYRTYDAADWEFTWQSDGGPLHVLNRNLITGPDRAYALYWSTPEDQWQESLATFQTLTETFQPAP